MIQYGYKHPSLYDFDSQFEELYIDAGLLEVVKDAYETSTTDFMFLGPQNCSISERPQHHPTQEERNAAVAGAEAHVLALTARAADSAAEGVFRVPLFTPLFCEHLLEELEHWEASGIPLRRPNGMNRYGAIMDDLGLGSALQGVASKLVRPLSQLLFPSVAVDEDFGSTYAFAVRYRLGEDVDLAWHTDASTITLNVCLGRGGFRGGRLLFGDVRSLGGNGRGFNNDEKEGGGEWPFVLGGGGGGGGLPLSSSNQSSSHGEVAFIAPGRPVRALDTSQLSGKSKSDKSSTTTTTSKAAAPPTPPALPRHEDRNHAWGFGDGVLHAGQHEHAASPLLSGSEERLNLIFWCYAASGSVRVAPYSPHEQSTPSSRWTTLPKVVTSN
jgi:hypothetical protein